MPDAEPPSLVYSFLKLIKQSWFFGFFGWVHRWHPPLPAWFGAAFQHHLPQGGFGAPILRVCPTMGESWCLQICQI